MYREFSFVGDPRGDNVSSSNREVRDELRSDSGVEILTVSKVGACVVAGLSDINALVLVDEVDQLSDTVDD